MGKILKDIFIMGPNGRPAIHVESAVAPGVNILDDRSSNLAFGLQHFQNLMAEKVLQISWLRARSYLEYPIVGKTAICDNGVQMGIEILKLTESLDGDSGTGGGAVIGDGLFQVGAQHFPGAARELGKQLSVIQEIDSQPLGDAEYPLPMGNGFEHFGT